MPVLTYDLFLPMYTDSLIGFKPSELALSTSTATMFIGSIIKGDVRVTRNGDVKVVF